MPVRRHRRCRRGRGRGRRPGCVAARPGTRGAPGRKDEGDRRGDGERCSRGHASAAVAGRRPATSRLGHGPGRSVSRDRGEERVLGKRVELGVTGRGHRRGAGDVAQQRDLAEALSTRQGRDRGPGPGDEHLAVGDGVVALARLALAHDHRPRGHGHGHEAVCDRLHRGCRERREQLGQAQEADLHDRHRRVAVDREQAAQPDQHHRRQHEPDADHGSTRTAEPGEQRHEQAPDRVAGHVEPLEHAEHARERHGVADALEQGAAGHVHEAARRARRTQQDEGAGGRALHPQDDERRAPHRHPDEQRRREPAPADERDGQRPARDPARAEGSVQEPDARAADVQDLEREHDVQHIEGAQHDRLRPDEPHQEPGGRVGPQRPQAGQRAAGRVVGCARTKRRAGPRRAPATRRQRSRARPRRRRRAPIRGRRRR